MRAQVTEKVKELSGDVGGSPAFLKYYQPGLSHVVKGLSPSEHAKMQSLATEWEERGAPVDVQRRHVGFLFTGFCCSIANYRNAEKSGTKFLGNVAKTAFKQFGMRLFLLVSHYNAKAELMVSLYVYLDYVKNFPDISLYRHDDNDRLGKSEVEPFAKAYDIVVDEALSAWEQYAGDINGIFNYLVTQQYVNYDRLQISEPIRRAL